MNKSLTFIPLNLADFKKYTQTFRTKLEQIEYLVENKLVVQNELEQNKNPHLKTKNPSNSIKRSLESNRIRKDFHL